MTNGRIEGFHIGVLVGDFTPPAPPVFPSRARIEHLDVSENLFAVRITDGIGHLVRRITADSNVNLFGVSLGEGTSQSTVTQSVIAGSQQFYGIRVEGLDNVVSHNIVQPFGTGISAVEAAGSGHAIVANTVVGATGPGISVAGSAIRVEGNDVSSAGDPLVGPGSPDRTAGIVVGKVFVLFDGSTLGVIVSRNRVHDNDNDGIYVDGSAESVLVVKNRAWANGLDGIGNEATGTTITRNRAYDNGELGIRTVFPVIDGGGNRARGNGDPARAAPPSPVAEGDLTG